MDLQFCVFENKMRGGKRVAHTRREMRKEYCLGSLNEGDHL